MVEKVKKQQLICILDMDYLVFLAKPGHFSVKFLEFNSLKETLDTSWVKHQKSKSLKRISCVFFIFQGRLNTPKK